MTFGLDVGGMEKLLVEFAKHADRERFDLRFVSLGGRGELAADVEAQGWPVVAMGEPTGVKPGLILRLAWLFRRWKTDVVHTHENRAMLHAVPAARLAAVRRVVHTRHGVIGISPRWVSIFRHLSRLTDRVVCVSDDCRSVTLRMGVSPAKLCRIWNGIDVERFAYTGPTAGGPIVAVGVLRPEKDHATLLRAVALVARDDPGVRVLIAGEGPCRPELERLIRELDLGRQVELLGNVHDVPTLLASAGLFVLPSLTEGVSLTLLEAMARGLPVVATRTGGNPEVVVEATTGLLAPVGDVSGLADALLRLSRDPEWCRRMGREGRHRVEQYFDVRRMVADYESLYLGSDDSTEPPPTSVDFPNPFEVGTALVGRPSDALGTAPSPVPDSNRNQG